MTKPHKFRTFLDYPLLRLKLINLVWALLLLFFLKVNQLVTLDYCNPLTRGSFCCPLPISFNCYRWGVMEVFTSHCRLVYMWVCIILIQARHWRSNNPLSCLRSSPGWRLNHCATWSGPGQICCQISVAFWDGIWVVVRQEFHFCVSELTIGRIRRNEL